jgi:hypothetical protein
MEKEILIQELEKIKTYYFDKGDYVSYNQVGRAIDVAEDYYFDINYKSESKNPMKKMTKQDFQNYIISEATKLYKIEVLKEEKEKIIGQLKVLNEGDGDGWTTAIMNVSEVDNFIDNYLDGWNLQYEEPIDLGDGKVSIRHQEETEDIMNQMNHQDAEERLSDMGDRSNYSNLD